MLTNLIENRGKEFSNILKIGDYLGRSLRENVELFSVENGVATYLTESGKVISGKYSFKPTLKLTGISVEDSSILENEDAFNSITEKKVSALISSLFEDSFDEAQGTFDKLLGLFETKLSYGRIKDRLIEKTQRFGNQTNIVETSEFKKLVDIKDKIVAFLKEQSNLKNIPEIKNSVKLASVVAKSFNLPKLTIDSIKESGVYEVTPIANHSVYEHLCRQELVRKELLEAKNHFDSTWAHDDSITELASLIYDSDKDKVYQKIAEIVTDVPYFALATKKQISTLISNAISLSELDVSAKDIQKFVSFIYEAKKNVKDYVLNLLNEKYGINVNNLSETPSFQNLIKTEQLIFYTLSKLAPKDSVIKEHLKNFADSLKIKNGVESIDVVTFLNEVFDSAGYKSAINETSLMQYLDFNQVADDLGKIGTILKLIRPMIQGGGGAQPQGMPAQGPQDPMGGGMKPEVPGIPPKPMAPGTAMDPTAKATGMPMPGIEDDEGTPEGAMDAEQAAGEVADEMDGAEQGDDLAGSPLPTDPMGQEEGPPESMDGDMLNNLVATIEDLLSGIKSQVGGGEEGMEGHPDAEEDEELIDAKLDDRLGDEEGGDEVDFGEEGDPEDEGEEDIHVDIDSHNVEGDEDEDDYEEEDDEEEAPAPKKKPPFKK